MGREAAALGQPWRASHRGGHDHAKALFEAHRLSGTLAGPLARLPGGTTSGSPETQAGSGSRRRSGGSHPAGAHQLTLEERLHRTSDPADGGLASIGAPAIEPAAVETAEAEPVEADPDGDVPQ